MLLNFCFSPVTLSFYDREGSAKNLEGQRKDFFSSPCYKLKTAVKRKIKSILKDLMCVGYMQILHHFI